MSELFHAAIPDAFIRQVFDTMVQTHWHGFQILTKRASWHDAFFEHLRLTFKLKHFILEPYVKEFTHHLGRTRPTVYYVDGFAGPGGYQRTTSEFEPGSPVLIANFAEHLRATNRSFTLKCLNVEANRQRYRRLVDATEVFTDHIVEKNYCAPFTGALADILRRRRRRRDDGHIVVADTPPIAKRQALFDRTRKSWGAAGAPWAAHRRVA
jgi:hypothetical protein